MSKRRTLAWCCGLFGLFLVLFYIQLTHGSIHLTGAQVQATLLGHGTDQDKLVLLQFRLPQVALSLICGLCLSISGALLQVVTENPLADTSIMGINAGASLGAVLFLALSHNFSGLNQTLALPLCAVAGSFCGALLTFLQRRQQNPLQLLLVGVATGTLLNGVILLIELQLNQFDFDKLIVWISGDFWNQDWHYIGVLAVAFVILLPFLLLALHGSDLLALGPDTASGLGLATNRKRQQLLGLAVLLAGLAVAGGGAISFVGLMAPHLARRCVGSRMANYLPVAALLGIDLILGAAIIAENLFAPSQLPVGLVVAVLTLPYFMLLLTRQSALNEL